MKLLQTDILLKDKTTYRIGGLSTWYGTPLNNEEIIQMVSWARENDCRVFILGNGSNILVSDDGWPGLTIDMSKHTGEILWEENRVCCHSGASLSALVYQSVERGLTGMECLAGIPGTIGGALIMNAGAFGQEISECLDYVENINCFDSSLSRYEKKQLHFGYRSSSLGREGKLITSASFTLNPGDRESLRQTYADILKKRAIKQPLDFPNCGSVFKRPDGNFAGALIEQSGCKGMSFGGACVSQKHANFIVNTGNACAEDVRTLIAEVQKRVYMHCGVLLEPEVLFIGTFRHSLFSPV